MIVAKIVFYCNDTIENMQVTEYYLQDIEALKALGHEVVVCNRYRDIPLRFDLLFIWWWTYALYPILIAKLLGRKSVVTGVFNFRFRVNDKNYGYFSRPIQQRLPIWLGMKLADANLFVSQQEFYDVTSYFRLKRSFYSPCSISEEFFEGKNLAVSRQGLLNISWSGTGNLERKGVWDILDAMKILKERGVRVQLTLAGLVGDGFPALVRRIDELGLQDYVQAVGRVSKEEKIQLLAKAKLYLQPSHFEGFGLATAEAMAAGCCAITCDVGEVRNVIGDCAHYVKPGQPAELASAIEMLLTDERTQLEFNMRSTVRLKALYSFSKKISTLGSIIRSLGFIGSKNL